MTQNNFTHDFTKIAVTLAESKNKVKKVQKVKITQTLVPIAIKLMSFLLQKT